MRSKIEQYFDVSDLSNESRDRKHVDARRLYAYLLQSKGQSIKQIADELNVSESRACRYVQEATDLIYAKHKNVIKSAYCELG